MPQHPDTASARAGRPRRKGSVQTHAPGSVEPPDPADTPEDHDEATAPGDRPSRRQTLALAGVSLGVMLAVVLILYLIGMTGIDEPAHRYKLDLLRDHQPLFWDGFWYAGNYGMLDYGVLYYALAFIAGPTFVTVASAALVPVLFNLYAWARLGVRSVAPAAVLVVTIALSLTSAQGPFLLALALSLAALVLQARGRPAVAAVAMGAALFTNPLAVVIAAVFVAADAIAHPAARRPLLVFVAWWAPFALMRLGVSRAFAQRSAYYTDALVAVKVIAYCVVGYALARWSSDPERRVKQAVFLVYAGLCAGVLVWPTDAVGNNVARLFYLFGASLLLAVRRPRVPRVIVGVLAAVCLAFQLVTPVGQLARPDEYRTSGAGYFSAVVTEARRLYDPDYRFHVLAPYRHAEAYYFPRAGFPIVRGWFGQLDGQHDRILLGDYDAAQYAAWLRDLGVNYVFAPRSRLQQRSKREEEALRASDEFREVYRDPDWIIYGVVDPEPIVVPVDGSSYAVAHVMAYRRDGLDLTVDVPGDYLVKVTRSPYWQVTAGDGTMEPAGDRFMELHAREAGSYALRLRVTPRAVLGELL